jgi:hypothetical protein
MYGRGALGVMVPFQLQLQATIEKGMKMFKDEFIKQAAAKKSSQSCSGIRRRHIKKKKQAKKRINKRNGIHTRRIM